MEMIKPPAAQQWVTLCPAALKYNAHCTQVNFKIIEKFPQLVFQSEVMP